MYEDATASVVRVQSTVCRSATPLEPFSVQTASMPRRLPSRSYWEHPLIKARSAGANLIYRLYNCEEMLGARSRNVAACCFLIAVRRQYLHDYDCVCLKPIEARAQEAMRTPLPLRHASRSPTASKKRS